MTNNYDAAVIDAIDRDLDDAERLEHMIMAVTNCQDAIAPDTGRPLGHPHRRWHPDDLFEVLQEQLYAMRIELNRVRSPRVVLD